MVKETVLAVKDLVKDYGEYRAVDHVTFTIERGQVMGLLGPNGAGKSTTIQMLLGITTRTSGSITYFGQDFTHHRQECLQRINFASAYNTLQGRMTVKENLQVFASLYRAPAAKTKIAELLNYFEISRMADQRYNDLSAGERTRVNLAKALLNDPELILMDEPTASLDPDIADKTLSLIEELRRDRAISILFTSHNMSEVERICDEVIFLYRGKIVSKDTPHNHMSRLDKATISLRYSGSRTALETCLRKQHVTYNEKDGQHVTIETTNSAIGALLESLAANNIRLLDIDIQKATLEDVFLDIARREKS